MKCEGGTSSKLDGGFGEHRARQNLEMAAETFTGAGWVVLSQLGNGTEASLEVCPLKVE
ncbi:MAG: hypothetical protein M0Z34_01010 [Nitrospiraceae bacterium]|nr:hypothetical protein [Nitrospiraceae bacterium]